MAKVLASDHYLSNAEVLHWVRLKRLQHTREDAEDLANNAPAMERPENFLNILERTERHLTSDAYPYEKNPSAYKGTNQDKAVAKFEAALTKAVHVPLKNSYLEKLRQGQVAAKKAAEELKVEQDKKELSEAEMLMVFNHAPTCVDMLQPMIEQVEIRFTLEEQEAVIGCIKEVLRPDEFPAGAEGE